MKVYKSEGSKWKFVIIKREFADGDIKYYIECKNFLPIITWGDSVWKIKYVEEMSYDYFDSVEDAEKQIENFYQEEKAQKYKDTVL